MSRRDKVVQFMHDLQDAICIGVNQRDSKTFIEDTWERDAGGGGRSRVIQSGHVFEKAGVNVSVVHGTLSEEAARSMGGGTDVEDLSFFATGMSLVFHPYNPFAPTVHANFRYFERGAGEKPGEWWFGGGADLTPSYLNEEDATHFHQVLKTSCDKFDPEYYPKYKKWCDEYFFIKHRNERRGLGGIFFDNLHEPGFDDSFAFVKEMGACFCEAYLPILDRRWDAPFGMEHKAWQQVRRGRYVEFNLVYDRGTTFGLKTGGRIESILMSLPQTAAWMYDHKVEPGSEEEKMQQVLIEPREWV